MLLMVLLLMLPPRINNQTPVLDIEAGEEVARGGRDGDHHLLGDPPLLQVPHKHPVGCGNMYPPLTGMVIMGM